MATKQFLRNTTVNGITDAAIASIIYDMTDAAGASLDTAVTRCPATSGEVQATKTDGGSTIAWISRRIASGFTLTQSDISMWQVESNMNANVGGRYRIYKYSGGVLTELGGGPFDDGVEMNTSDREDTWVGNNTDTAFAVDDRIVIKYFVTNVGSSSNSFTATAKFNEADGSTGDSFINFAETISFKAEEVIVAPAARSAVAAIVAPTVKMDLTVAPAARSAVAAVVAPTIPAGGVTVTPTLASARAGGFAVRGLAALWTTGMPNPDVLIQDDITVTPVLAQARVDAFIPQIIVPAPAIAAIAVVAPTVVSSGSSQTVTPAAIYMRTGKRFTAGLVALWTDGTPDPTVVIGGDPHITPTLAVARALALDPTVLLGSITVSPSAAIAAAAIVNPNVILGSLVIAPANANAKAVVIAPNVILGSLTITPTLASVVAAILDPTVIAGGNIVVTPPFASAIAAVIAPNVIQGNLIITPANANARAVVIAPTIIYSPITPVLASAVAAIANPIVAIGGNIIIVPNLAAARALAVNPTVLGGLVAMAIGVVPVRYVIGQTKNVVPVETVGAPGIGIVPVREFVGPANVVPVREVGGGETPRVKVVKV